MVKGFLHLEVTGDLRNFPSDTRVRYSGSIYSHQRVPFEMWAQRYHKAPISAADRQHTYVKASTIFQLCYPICSLISHIIIGLFQLSALAHGSP
jgi:hypothetical protein